MVAMLTLLVGSLVAAGSAEAGGLRGGTGASLNLTQQGRLLTGSSMQTDITGRLNANLDLADRGVLVRTPDFLSGSDRPKPATLWRSDIYPPNQFYMAEPGPVLVANKPYVGYAVDDDKWDDVILNTYYPHDANACDAVPTSGPDAGAAPVLGRCLWTGENWECPGAWVAADGGILVDTTAVGASENACRGCHFDESSHGADDWYMNQDFDVVGDNDCNCPGPDEIDYSSQDGVCEWVQTNLVDTGKIQNPSWWGDATTCWVDNPVALSYFQNCYYWKYYRDDASSAAGEWWGWNEIGASAAVDDPGSWQAVLLFLPAQLQGQGFGDLPSDQQQEVQDILLNQFLDKNKIQVGADYMTQRPGSYVVMANEYPDDDASNPNWYHYFFCQSWTPAIADPKIQVCFKPQEEDPDGNGYCYLEWAGQPCA